MPKWCVVSCPPCISPETVAREVAPLIGQPVPTTSQLLQSRYPRLLCWFDKNEEAGQLSTQLVLSGLISFVVNSDDLETSYELRVLRRLTMEPERFLAVDEDATEYSVPWASIYLIIKGRLEKPAGAARSGPMESSDKPMFAHIFSRECSQALVIEQLGFDYTCLGSQKGPTTISNFNKIIDITAARAPGHVLDDSLLRLTPSELIALRTQGAQPISSAQSPAIHLATLIYLRARYGPKRRG